MLSIQQNRDAVAVMDLGTNSFHLLIAAADGYGGFTELAHLHEPVRLGEGGINSGKIRKEPYDRGVKALTKFSTVIAAHGVKTVKCIGTSALRNAANGQKFIDEVNKKTGIIIELINGKQEAEYIYKGVKACGCLIHERSLIMDIGGGSVEFILCTPTEIIWKQSFEIGAARLMDRFQKTDPLSPECIAELDKYLNTALIDLYRATAKVEIDKLIGSAGAFETFAQLIEDMNHRLFDIKAVKSYDYDLRDFIQVTNSLVRSTHEERMQMPGIIPLRVDMIVVASLLTRYIMDRINIGRVGMSAYALKEGVLSMFIN
jgi:exopolyphosphatase/guanosine-5'-triphosphate,3'-diphosphate pyrophosphatase